ncbi:MAG: hypothetical protein CVU68_09890 [Deltaproteobacteria bacterium HGW-Deltaproteobacteria-3]|nr:MAG: hypothetical protein CVU68_09890 [Deltaproteobacteria bacterium HGW-Deltaproteobacteria-3]
MMKGRAMFTMLLSRVDMKTPVATMRKVGHLFAGEDTEGICCLWDTEGICCLWGKKSGIGRPDALALVDFFVMYRKSADPAKRIAATMAFYDCTH